MEEAGDMEAAGRRRELAGEVGDLVTSVNPAMARGAMPWWGERTGIGSFFGEEPQGEASLELKACTGARRPGMTWSRGVGGLEDCE